jgi:hypothetical protein
LGALVKIFEILFNLKHPQILKITSEGIKIRTLDFIPWSKVFFVSGENIHFLSSIPVVNFWLLEQIPSSRIPLWWRVQRARYYRQDDKIKIGIDIAGTNANVDEILEYIRIKRQRSG